MGEGIEKAKELDPKAAKLIEDMRDQLLIVFLRRLGGRVTIPVAEIDDTGHLNFLLGLDETRNEFTFELAPKTPKSPQPSPSINLISAPPVDRSQQTLTTGGPVPADDSHREIQPDGMQKGYVVLTEEERRRGFVRPVRQTYIHTKCGTATTMGISIAETYARDPAFYSGTYCTGPKCKTHYPLDQFTWEDGTQVGS